MFRLSPKVAAQVLELVLNTRHFHCGDSKGCIAPDVVVRCLIDKRLKRIVRFGMLDCYRVHGSKGIRIEMAANHIELFFDAPYRKARAIEMIERGNVC